MYIIEISNTNRQQVNDFIISHWFSTDMAVRGELVDMTRLDGFVVYDINEIIGLVTYRIDGSECEIMSLDSLVPNEGIGTTLTNKVIEAAKKRNCSKVKLITTNDNINAISFYQKRGFDMVCIYRNSLETARKLKPSIPMYGDYNIPLKHEIEFEMNLRLQRKTQHFIINYGETDKECIDTVAEVLEANYARVTDNLKCQPKDKLSIEIHSNLKEMHIALGIPDAPDWVRGGLGKGKVVIASPLNPPPGSKFDNVVNTAVHEFVHTVIKNINDNIPRWLDEGIASYEAKDNNPAWIKKTVAAGLQNDTIPSFSDLDTGADFQAFFAKDGYQYSYTIIESVVNTFGYDKLSNLIKSPNNFIEVFSMNQNELEKNWIEYIKRNYKAN